jgi:hypothetical protein
VAVALLIHEDLFICVLITAFSAQNFLFVCRLQRFLHRFFYLCVDYGVFCTEFFTCVSIMAFSVQNFLFVCRLWRFRYRIFYLCVDYGVFGVGFVRCVALYKKKQS